MQVARGGHKGRAAIVLSPGTKAPKGADERALHRAQCALYLYSRGLFRGHRLSIFGSLRSAFSPKGPNNALLARFIIYECIVEYRRDRTETV